MKTVKLSLLPKEELVNKLTEILTSRHLLDKEPDLHELILQLAEKTVTDITFVFNSNYALITNSRLTFTSLINEGSCLVYEELVRTEKGSVYFVIRKKRSSYHAFLVFETPKDKPEILTRLFYIHESFLKFYNLLKTFPTLPQKNLNSAFFEISLTA